MFGFFEGEKKWCKNVASNEKLKFCELLKLLLSNLKAKIDSLSYMSLKVSDLQNIASFNSTSSAAWRWYEACNKQYAQEQKKNTEVDIICMNYLFDSAGYQNGSAMFSS